MKITELHSEAWAALDARRAQLPHALLISGQRGNGKYEFARAFAESLLCERPSGTQACGACLACGWLAQGNHPDLRLLQPLALAEAGGDEAGAGGAGAETSGKKKPSQQITIDQVRSLDEFLHVGTHRDGARIVLINPAEAMNRATANSLLKALEEPIEKTLFILVSSEPERLLPTIRSRCQAIGVAQPPGARGEAWLAQAGVKDAALWLALAGGSPLLAVDLADSEESVLVAALVAQMSRGAPAANFDALAAAAGIDRIVKSASRPAALKRTLEWMQKWLLDLTLAKAGLPVRYFIAQAGVVEKLAESTSSARLLAFEKKTLQYRLQCEQPLNSRLFLEALFLDYAALFGKS